MHCECYWVYAESPLQHIQLRSYAFRIGSIRCAIVLLCCCACACAQLVSAQLCSAWCVFYVLFHWKQNVCFDCLCILLHSRCIDAIWFVVIVLVFRPRYGFTIYIVAQNTAETHENTIRLVCRFRCISVNCFVFSPLCRSSRSLFCPLSRFFGLAHIEYPSHFSSVWQCSSFLPHVSVNWELSKKREKYVTSKCWTDGGLMTVDSEYASDNDILQKMNSFFSYLR